MAGDSSELRSHGAPKEGITRRELLRRGALIGLGTSALGSLLAACAGQAPSAPAPTAAAPASGAAPTAAPAPAATAASAASSAQKVTLTFWTHTHPPMIKLNQALIDEYQKAHPNVTIDYQQIPNTDFFTKMLTALSTGSGPDCFNMSDVQLRGEYILKKLVSPVDPAALGFNTLDDLKAAYIPGGLAGAQGKDGTIYGLPSEYNVLGFAYNAAHFQEAGLNPAQPPKTWDELATQGAKLVQRSGDRMTRQAFNFLYLTSSYFTGELYLLLNQTGGTVLNADGTQGALDSPAAKQALEVWNNLINVKQLGDPKANANDATVPYVDFYTGKLSSCVMFGPWVQPPFAADYKDNYKNMRLSIVPQVDPAKPVSRAYGYNWTVNTASKNKQEAWRFLGYLASQSDRWLSDVGFVQARKNWNQSPAAQKMDNVDAWAKIYDTGKYDTVGPHWSEIQDAIRRTVERTILNKVPAADSLKQGQDDINRILKG